MIDRFVVAHFLWKHLKFDASNRPVEDIDALAAALTREQEAQPTDEAISNIEKHLNLAPGYLKNALRAAQPAPTDLVERLMYRIIESGFLPEHPDYDEDMKRARLVLDWFDAHRAAQPAAQGVMNLIERYGDVCYAKAIHESGDWLKDENEPRMTTADVATAKAALLTAIEAQPAAQEPIMTIEVRTAANGTKTMGYPYGGGDWDKLPDGLHPLYAAPMAQPAAQEEPDLVEGVTIDLLEGIGASEDHETFIKMLRDGGLSEATAREVHRRMMTSAQEPRK